MLAILDQNVPNFVELATSLQLLGGRVHVVAHEVELVVISTVGRMGSELRGRQPEDQPAVTGIDRREPEDVPESSRTPSASLP
jgi:hypothetical protein